MTGITQSLGTIHTFPSSTHGAPLEELFPLQNRPENEIVISVRAVAGVTILLYDKDSNEEKNRKVAVTMGSDTASIGFPAENEKYPTVSTDPDDTKGMLSPVHFKTFIVRWVGGRVMLYRHGMDHPLLRWYGPEKLGFTNVGVRTVGCTGQWRVQGMPTFTTPDSIEYHDVQVNCGLLEFKLRAWGECRLHLVPEEGRRNGDGEVYVAIGGWDPGANKSGRHSWFIGGEEKGFSWEPKEAVAPTPFGNHYRKFWIKWDATNLFFGHGGDTFPTATVLNYDDGFPTFKYFGFKAMGGTHADWFITD